MGEQVVKCVDWDMLSSREGSTIPAKHVRDSRVLLHIAANANIVFSTEVENVDNITVEPPPSGNFTYK